MPCSRCAAYGHTSHSLAPRLPAAALANCGSVVHTVLVLETIALYQTSRLLIVADGLHQTLKRHSRCTRHLHEAAHQPTVSRQCARLAC